MSLASYLAAFCSDCEPVDCNKYGEINSYVRHKRFEALPKPRTAGLRATIHVAKLFFRRRNAPSDNCRISLLVSMGYPQPGMISQAAFKIWRNGVPFLLLVFNLFISFCPAFFARSELWFLRASKWITAVYTPPFIHHVRSTTHRAEWQTAIPSSSSPPSQRPNCERHSPQWRNPKRRILPL